MNSKKSKILRKKTKKLFENYIESLQNLDFKTRLKLAWKILWRTKF